MKLFVDDVRFPPNDTWNDRFVHDTKTMGLDNAVPRYMFGILYSMVEGNESITDISFDHDLGDDDVATGYDILKRTIDTYYLSGIILPKITIHSANPVGCERMERLLEEYNQRLGKQS